MDRTTDLTIAALLARDDNPTEALREDYLRLVDEQRCGFSNVLNHVPARIHFLGGIRISTSAGSFERQDVDSFFGQPVSREPEDDPNSPMWEQFNVYERVFGEPHPRYVEIDPYSFMWGNDTDCDRCGVYMHFLNRPDPCYGVCTRCEEEMAEETENYEL